MGIWKAAAGKQWEIGTHQNDMHECLIQRSSEVSKAVNALAVTQSLRQGSPDGQACNITPCSSVMDMEDMNRQPSSFSILDVWPLDGLSIICSACQAIEDVMTSCRL